MVWGTWVQQLTGQVKRREDGQDPWNPVNAAGEVWMAIPGLHST